MHKSNRPTGCKQWKEKTGASCIHIIDALLRWEHAEEALFSFEELEREANRRGFRTVKKAIDLGMEGYFRFQKE